MASATLRKLIEEGALEGEALAVRVLTHVQLRALIEALDQYTENQAEHEEIEASNYGDNFVPSADLEACRGLLEAAQVERLRRCGVTP